MNFLHNFIPQPIFLQFGPLAIRYYGLIIIVAVIVCFCVAIYLAKKKNIVADDIFDLVLWLVIGGIVGARLYDVFFIDWNYFYNHLLSIFKIWEGGLAIHGVIIGGVIALILWCKAKKKDFWKFAALIFTVLPLGQAIGRWGNYFNQELFGWPTSLPWEIPIAMSNRPANFLSSQYFQPVFLYESVLNLILFIILFFIYKKNRVASITLPFIYLIGYSVIRFFMEFIRIDPTPIYLGLRLPQIVSLIVLVGSILFLFLRKFHTAKS